jgi:3-oxoacyl-[acyl-carrier protein] reductase
MSDRQEVILITGTRKGIGRYLAEYYSSAGYRVVGCSRNPMDAELENYQHYCLDVADESKVKQMFGDIRATHGRLDILINNAGVASMNHALLTPLSSVQNVLNTNFVGTFLACREAAKLMRRNHYGRIVNFATVATPLRLEGEAVYASAKAGVVTLTQILAREFADFGITVNAVGPTPVETDLIRSVPKDKIQNILNRQAIRRFGEFRDIANVIDFFIRPESDFITGQVVYLGGIG